jgi:hypothetical protein
MTRCLALSMILIGMTCMASACDALPFLPRTTSSTVNGLTYDAPVTLTVKSGALLPGTTIAYGGKTTTGAAKVLITGLVAAKQTGDSVDWQGIPAPDVNVSLSTRVVTFDDQGINLFGTAHIEIGKVVLKPGDLPGSPLMEFSAPVSYSLAKDAFIPGTTVAFAGVGADGAQFLGIEGYPYRKSLDSLQYTGQLNPKAFLKLDLRLINYSDSGVVLGGTANIRISQ